MNGEKIQFEVLAGELVLLLRIFGVGDGFAQTAGVLAVEGFRHGIVEGTRLEVAGKHRRPGDGLEKRPMRAEGGYERENDQNFAKP